ncbi:MULTISPECIES: DUF362 domain-containing protein [Dictyoglomus]|jgi:uncharacterized protein (DUF362 family)/ferredoxin|uniref:DUF362 domain-containing protein n=1 Tax=Dictyoglomus TaxID=13 RepID=UPI000CCDBFBD|nr:DUF362 domain-containing protein [Dictyoglomus turgidum]PNV79558.1 MAG: hypothetical protein C0196_05350 [Dictyoglomus turgidum]
MSSKVIVYNAEYEKESLKDKIKRALEYFDLPNFKGKRVFIKPNLLMASSPDKAITTHPTVIEAIIEILKEKEAREIFIGDTPGNTSTNLDHLYRVTGMKEVAERQKVNLVNLYTYGVVNIKSEVAGNIPLTKFIKEVDYIINVPKLKTHTFMLMTCTIKNTFGLVPGMNKSRMHAIAINPENFAKILVEIFSEVNPVINIVDAIVGMEGEGPSAGTPRKFGKIITGKDPVAVDVVSSLLLGYKPEEIYTNLIAYKKGLGEINIEKIEVIGEEKDKIYNHDVVKVKNFYSLSKNVPAFMGSITSFLYNKLIRQYPVIEDEKCIKCRICENSCPNKAITYDSNKMIIDYKKCISCFCCHELCPQKAIRLEKSLLARRLFR